MSVTLFTGVPGSGKSYKMMAETWKNKDKYFIIHNIIGFDDELLNGFGFNWQNYLVENNIEADTFFSKDYQSELAKKIREKYKRSMLVIIDEAHEWFDMHKKQIKMWLSYHRHLDQSIYLVAHASSNIPRVYRTFVEMEFRAKTTSVIFLPWWFMYNRIVGTGGGERLGYIFERKKKEIFELYKSADISEGKKNKSYMIYAMAIFIIIGTFLFFNIGNIVYGKKVKKQKENVESINQKTAGVTIQKEEKNTDNEKYAYVGIILDRAVIEERKTGKQYDVRQLGYTVIMNRGAEYIALAGKGGQVLELYNRERYQEKNHNQVIENNITERTPERLPVSDEVSGVEDKT